MDRRPLDGVTVVDWTVWQFGPVSTMMLGDLGADVVKIESPQGDPGRAMRATNRSAAPLAGGRTAYFESNNRNKRSITLDLRRPEARQVVYKLVARSDVFVQNFRVGVAERMGMGYETLKRYNSRLIYASGSGFGELGPDAARPTFDATGQARAGIMSANALPGDDPRPLAGGVADQVGGIMLAFGVLSALVARNTHGIGQRVDVSHLGSLMWLQGLAISMGLLNGRFTAPGDRASAANPLVNRYQCRDGRWIQFMNLQADRYWPDFCKLVGRVDLVENPKFENMMVRSENSRELIVLLDHIFATKTYDEWEAEIKRVSRDIVYARVQSLSELELDPQVIANEYIAQVDHPTLGKVKLANHPVHYSETPARISRTAPELGQHTEEVLESLGYSWEQMAQLRELGALG